MKKSNITICEALTLRSEFEEITRDFSMSFGGSDIHTIEWFIENGHRSNSLRNGFDRAKQIALTIMEYIDVGKGTKNN